MSLRRTLSALLALPGLLPATAGAAELGGGALAPTWGLPFAGVLLTIALLPLAAPAAWHRHYGKVALAWSLAFLVPFAVVQGAGTAAQALAHAALAEYVPFIVLLIALYVVAGGIHLRGDFRGSPGVNTLMLAVGAILASLMGTTGASMLLIRPLIRANAERPRCEHVVVFFILIVGNVGGALTPLGDPPLFLGFLQGVDFFWTARHLWPQTLFMVAALLAMFYAIDDRRYRSERSAPGRGGEPRPVAFALQGKINLLLLLVIVALVLMSGMWKPAGGITILGTHVGLQQIVRDVSLVAVIAASLVLTPAQVHADNRFDWAPMREVAILFAAIFITIVPVLAMLGAGSDGAFAPVIEWLGGAGGQPRPAAYFWATGLLSSVLDNAPTYLVFFNLAGGDAARLMTELAPVLAAISAGAVFMGALTYVGNAPNLMIKAIAESRGIRMPSFFGFMAWSCAALVPLLLLTSLIWFA